jgi:hypothetical protein
MNRPFVLTMLLAVAVLSGAGCGSSKHAETPAASATASPSPSPTFPAVPTAWPFVFNGDARVGGTPVPAGLQIAGRINEYRSASVTTEEGRYSALAVGPLDPKFFDQPIVFELTRPSDGKTVPAEETMVFRALPQPSVFRFTLTFPPFE